MEREREREELVIAPLNCKQSAWGFLFVVLFCLFVCGGGGCLFVLLLLFLFVLLLLCFFWGAKQGIQGNP